MLFWNCVDLVHEAMNLWTYEAMNQQNMCLFDHSLKVLYNSVLFDLTRVSAIFWFHTTFVQRMKAGRFFVTVNSFIFSATFSTVVILWFYG